MDRLNENGIIALITNRSFIDGRAFDGFRKTVQEDFDFAYIIDTRSDVRSNPKIAGTTHNVFGIQAGVAIMFLVKTSFKKIKADRCKLSYFTLDDNMLKEEKLLWFASNSIEKLEFDNITPDQNNNWINNTDNNWDELIPIFDKEGKSGKSDKVIFRSFSLGIATHRDFWLYDLSRDALERKVKYFIDEYNESRIRREVSPNIAWDEDLIRVKERDIALTFDNTKIIKSSFRPFSNRWVYYDNKLISRIYSYDKIFQDNKANQYISLRCISSDDELTCLSSEQISDLGYLKTGNGGTFSTALYSYNQSGETSENITDWAKEKFSEKYNDKSISKLDIFHYVYAVLHSPIYRKKYELNLRRHFPRIPLYQNFHQWVNLGRQLMYMHQHFDKAIPFGLERIEIKKSEHPITKLQVRKEDGIIIIDENTLLKGIPSVAWGYKLGNRSALEWVIDQFKSKKNQANVASYNFTDYKEQAIELIDKVCSISVNSIQLIELMKDISVEYV
jgi:predicted helicase